MKSLSLSRPLVIMMLGVPGAGKSFFARQFSDMFNAPLVSIDRLRYELFTEPTYSKDEETIVQRIAYYQIDELLKTNKTFIVDGAMSTRVNRAAIERAAKAKGYETLIVWVQTDAATSRIRSLKRNPKRLFDEYNVSLTPELYEKLVKRISPPLPREAYLVISGKHTYATQAKMVLKKLIGTKPETPSDNLQPQPERPYPQAPLPPTRRNLTIQ